MIKYEKTIDNIIESEIVVVGSGAAGTNAAIAAGRQNKKTLIVERYGFIGGTSTFVLDTFYGFYMPNKTKRKVVGGTPDLIVERLKSKDAMILRENTYGAGTGVTYDPEILKVVYEELLQEANVDILLHTFVVDVVMEEGKVTGIIVVNKSGYTLIKGEVFIDASGDADVATLAGHQYDGVNSHTPVQSLTTTFRMNNVDDEKAKSFSKEDMWRWMREANASDKYHLPREEGSVHITTIPGVMATNMVRLHIADPTNILELSKAEIEGRKQALEYFRFMKDYLPGYENAHFLNFSTQIGVRETRRVIGEYTLTKEDLLAARKFDDVIAQCGAPMEDHHADSDTKWQYIPEGKVYQIPFRSLIPKGSINLLVAGRCLSATHDAHASVRNMAQCMATGMATGVAASMMVENDISVGELNIETLQKTLLNAGAMFEYD